MDPETMAELKEKFSVLDQNGDGFLDKNELVDMLVPLGSMLGVDQWEMLFKEMDSSGDGKVDLDEFLAFVFEVRESCDSDEKMDALSERVKNKFKVSDQQVRKAAKAAFDAADPKKTGSITKKDALGVIKKFVTDLGLPKLSDNEAEEVLQLLDKDANQRLTFDELVPFARDCLEMHVLA